MDAGWLLICAQATHSAGIGIRISIVTGIIVGFVNKLVG